MNDPRSPDAPPVTTPLEPLPGPAAPAATSSGAARPAAPDQPPANDGAAPWVGFLAGLALLLAGFIWLALIATPPGG